MFGSVFTIIHGLPLSIGDEALITAHPQSRLSVMDCIHLASSRTECGGKSESGELGGDDPF